MLEYSHLTPQDYYQLSQFSGLKGRESVSSFLEDKKSGQDVRLYRVQISQDLAFRILDFIRKDGLNTRGPAPDVSSLIETTFSQTVYTVHFALHFIIGKRGGWFILENGGREPVIKDEFIAYGPKRKSGSRKHRYRRNLSYSEQNQVDHLKSITPPLEQMFDWILKKYRGEIRNLDFHSETA
ncbi:hypothetical protein [Sulfitobacter geojensis]|nr:hypothetical protein [Sulfitobacter geojensis]MBM1764767.1 hypothetical protein [Sulfitobacter geojensis]MBM1781038.1 hypothetical protein [Sulfitobacter geojensis]MBM1793230.1 hypothetical protein [Sulfitobacter geojensis]MBM1830413.1 hypothetical protein [Sulfitobacter geojensis]